MNEKKIKLEMDRREAEQMSEFIWDTLNQLTYLKAGQPNSIYYYILLNVSDKLNMKLALKRDSYAIKLNAAEAHTFVLSYIMLVQDIRTDWFPRTAFEIIHKSIS